MVLKGDPKYEEKGAKIFEEVGLVGESKGR